MIRVSMTQTISGYWKIEGIAPTVAEWLLISTELNESVPADLRKQLTLSVEPPGINGAGRDEKARVVLDSYTWNPENVEPKRV